MRILAVIPARGGSKRLPGKNLRLLAGKPLLVWSIEAARDVPEISDILVSTDDAPTAEAARRSGALVPWLRPAELATDTASSVDVCLHALDWYESKIGKPDAVLLLQPTSPCRRHETMLRGIDLFRAHAKRAVIGVSPAASHPLWCFTIDGHRLTPFVDGGGLNLRAQDLPATYTVNGAFYLITPQELRERHSFFGPDSVPLVMQKPEEAIDIDTEFDWQVAEVAMNSTQ
jgi:CMP-N,N'-diacetyllegionaminic acid synthase